MKMIKGGRALAAALAGAPVYVREHDGKWHLAPKGDVLRWRRSYNANLLNVARFAVRADDARRVL